MTEHICGESMPKLMSALSRCLDTGASKIISNYGGDGYCTKETSDWGTAANEDAAAVVFLRSSVSQIRSNRSTNFGG